MDLDSAKKYIKKNMRLGKYKNYTRLEFIAHVSSKLRINNATNSTDTILYNIYKRYKKKDCN